jgi:hypothetical protein
MESSPRTMQKTEPFPPYDDVFHTHNPPTGHCCLHCTHDICIYLRSGKVIPVYTECKCGYSGAPRPYPEAPASPKSCSEIAKGVQLDAELSHEEITALDDFDLDLDIEIPFEDAQNFIKDITRRFSTFWQRAFADARPDILEPSPLQSEECEKHVRWCMFDYFDGSLNHLPTKKTITTARHLRLQLWAYLAVSLHDLLCSKGIRVPGGHCYLGPKLFLESSADPRLHARIWRAYEDALDNLVFLFVLRHLRSTKGGLKGDVQNEVFKRHWAVDHELDFLDSPHFNDPEEAQHGRCDPEQEESREDQFAEEQQSSFSQGNVNFLVEVINVARHDQAKEAKAKCDAQPKKDRQYLNSTETAKLDKRKPTQKALHPRKRKAPDPEDEYFPSLAERRALRQKRQAPKYMDEEYTPPRLHKRQKMSGR